MAAEQYKQIHQRLVGKPETIGADRLGTCSASSIISKQHNLTIGLGSLVIIIL